MTNEDKKLSKVLHNALFRGVMTVADFRSALEIVINNIVAFKKEMTVKIDAAISGIHNPTDAELTALIRPFIPKVKDGKTPTKEEILVLIKPLIPKVKDGETPTDERLLKLIKKIEETGEEIIRKVNNDPSDSLIRKGKVEGLEDIENMARTADANSRSFMNTGSYVYAQDISDQLNGVLKTFILVSNAKVILAFGSSAPGVFRPTTDYTTTGSTITFTSEITAASTLAAGQTVIILYKIL